MFGVTLRSEVNYEFRDTNADTGAILSELQDAQERMAGRRIYISKSVLLLPGLRRGHGLHLRGSWCPRLFPRRTEGHEGGTAARQAAFRRARPGGRVERFPRQS